MGKFYYQHCGVTLTAVCVLICRREDFLPTFANYKFVIYAKTSTFSCLLILKEIQPLPFVTMHPQKI